MDQEDLANIQLGVSEEEGEKNSDKVLILFLSPPTSNPLNLQDTPRIWIPTLLFLLPWSLAS